GPGGLGLIQTEEAILTLAEIGVGLLLFSIGIELSLERIGAHRNVALGGGSLQVIGTAVAAAVGIGLWTARPVEGAFIGCALALSSSAIILKTLADRGDLDAPYTATATGVAI